MFYYYFIEIRNRLLFLFLSIFSTFLTCCAYKEIMFYIFLKSSVLKKFDNFYFLYTNITEVISLYFDLSYFACFHIFLITFCYHFFLFISPGLYNFEYQIIKKFFFINIVVLIIFTSFCIDFMFEFIIELLFNFYKTILNSHLLFFEANIFYYYKFYCRVYCTFCIIIIMFLSLFFSIFYIKSYFLHNILLIRKSYYIVILFVSTCITPPDIISQLFLFFCFIFIFELYLFVVIISGKISFFKEAS